jgi:WD40 repeat protein
MKPFIYVISLLFVIGLPFTQFSTVDAQDNGTSVTATTRGNLNVRAEPSSNAALVGSLGANTTVDVHRRFLNDVGELWLLVPFKAGEAWIAGWLVDMGGNIETVPWLRLTPGSEPITLDNLDRLEPVASFPRHFWANLFDPVWLPDGRLVVGNSGAIDVYTPDGQLLETWPMPYDISGFIVHPSGEWLLYFREDFSPLGVFSYNITTGEHRHWEQLRLRGWEYGSFSDYAWSSDGSLLMLFSNWSASTTNSYGYQTYVIDVLSQNIVGQQDLECNGFVESDTKVRCQQSSMSAFTSFDIETGETGEITTMFNLKSMGGQGFESVTMPLFSNDGSQMLYRGRRDQVHSLVLADAATFEPLLEFTGILDPRAVNSDLSLAVINECFGRCTATSGSRSFMLDLVTGKELFDVPGDTRYAAFSPDDAYVAIVTLENVIIPTMHVYEIASGRNVWEISAPADAAISLVFSPNGQSVIQVLADQSLVRTSLATNQTTQIMNSSISFSIVAYNLDPLGRYIIQPEQEQDYTVLYDAQRMAEVQRISQSQVLWWSNSFFSRDGRYLLRSISENGVLLLDLENSSEVGKLMGHELDSHTCKRVWEANFDNTRQAFLPINDIAGIVALLNYCDQGIILWSYNERRAVTMLTDYEPLSLFFQQDKLIALGHDNTIHVYDVSSQQEITAQQTPYRPITMLNDTLVVLETPDWQYVFWDMVNAQIVGDPLTTRPYLLSPDRYLMAGVTGDQLTVYAITGESK